MRYVVFAAIGIVSVILSGSFFGYATVAGLVPDLILIVALSIVMNEHTVMGVVYATIFGLLTDDLFSPVLGGNALAYTLSVVIIFAALRNIERIRPWVPAVTGVAAYVIKEMVVGVIVFALGTQYDLLYMLTRFILPGALLTAGLMVPAYYIMRWLYSFAWMRPRKEFKDDLDL